MLLPFDWSEIAISAIASDGHYAAAALFAVRALGELHRCEDVRARGMADVQTLLGGDAIGHVPAVFGADWHDLVRQVRVVDARHDAGSHVLQALETVQGFGGLRRDAVDLAWVLVQPARGAHGR